MDAVRSSGTRAAWHHAEQHAVASMLVAGFRAAPRDMSSSVVLMLAGILNMRTGSAERHGHSPDHVSPPLFLSLVHTPHRLLNELRHKLRLRRKRYLRCVECIDKTELAALRNLRWLKAMLPKLRDTDVDAEPQMAAIRKQFAGADAMQELVEAETAACAARMVNAQQLQARCDERLVQAALSMDFAT